MKSGLYARLLACLLPLLFLWPTPAPAQRPELIVQSGHSDVVSVLAFSPDGSVLASGSGDSSLKLWDAATGKELRTLDGHTSVITAVAFNSDGTLLASGSVDGTVRVWDVATGRLLRAEKNPAHSVQWIQFTADNKLLALGGSGKIVKQWVVGEADKALTFAAHPDVVTDAALTKDGKLMASGSQDGTIKIWDVAAVKQLHTLKGFNVSGLVVPGAGKLAFSPDKRILAYVDSETLRLWSLASGAELRVLSGHPMPIASFAFSPGGDLIATAGNDNTVKIWKVADGAQVHNLTGHTEVVFSVAFNPASKTIAGGSGSWTKRTANEVKLWSTETGKQLRSYKGGSVSGIKAVSFSADGKSIATHSGEAVKFWNTADGLMSGSKLSGDQRMTVTAPIAFSPDHKLVASRVGEGHITIREVATGREVQRLSEEDGISDSMVVTPLVFSHDGKFLARGNSNGEITLADLVRRSERKIPAHAGRVRCLAFSPDSELMASGGEDGTIKIWSTATYAVTQTLKGQFDVDKAPAAMRLTLFDFEIQTDEPIPDRVFSVAFSKDNKTLASGSYSGVTLWDARAGKQLAALTGHPHLVSAVAFSPDGMLASGSWDNTIKLWDVASRKEAGTLAAHVNAISSLAFSPTDPRLLVSGSSDATAKLWDVIAREELASLITLNEADWLVTTPAGLFDGSPTGWKQVLWRFSAEMRDVLPVESFFNELYRPGLLAELARGERPQSRPGIDLNRLDRRQPRLKLTLAHRGLAAGPTITAHNVRIRLDVGETPKEGKRTRGSGARDVRLFRNGSLVKAWRGDALRGRASTVLVITVPVVAGENRFTAYAFNHDNVKSEDAELSVTGAPSLQRKGTAYVLSVGIDEYQNSNYNLNYAVTDARVFAEEFRRLQQVGLPADLRRFSRVEVVSLHNEQAAKNNIMLALRRLSGEHTSPLPHRHPLSGLRLAKPEDAVVVYFAGHGKAAGGEEGEAANRRFYLIPHDMDYSGPRVKLEGEALEAVKRSAISDRELEAAFERVDAGQLLLVIDACHSGEALESEEWRRGPMNSRGLAQLAYEKGMHILTASQGYQAAKESARLGHGLLTYALVEGLKDAAADADGDGRVLVREWLDFAVRRVPQLQTEEENCRGLRADVECPAGDKQGPAEQLRAQQERQRPRVFYRREEDARPLVLAARTAGR